MKKIYIVAPLGAVFAFATAYFSTQFATVCMTLVPFFMYLWIRKNEAEVYLNSLGANERIIYFALENRELVPFIGKKVSEEYAKVKDKLIHTRMNTVYIFSGKPIMFAKQSPEVDVEDIYRVKNAISERLVSPKMFTKRSFWKICGTSIAGFITYYFFGFFHPIITFLGHIISWIIMFAGVFVALVFAYRSGALQFMGGAGGGKTMLFYFSGAKKLEPLEGALKAEGYAQLPGYGLTRLADNTYYLLAGKPVFFTARGVNHTFRIELAEKATWFRRGGFRDWVELSQAEDLIEKGEKYENYDSVEQAVEKEGGDYIKEARKRANKIREQWEVNPYAMEVPNTTGQARQHRPKR